MATAQLNYTPPGGSITSLVATILAIKGFDKAEAYRFFPALKHQMLDGSLRSQNKGYARNVTLDLGVIQDSATMKAILYFLMDDDRTLEYANADLTTNGTFASDTAWTKGTGWTIGSGKATHAAGSASAIEQDDGAVALRAYRITFTVSSRTAGTLTPEIGGVSGTAISTNTTSVQFIKATGTGNLKFNASSTFDGKIDDVSVYVCVPVVMTDPGGYEDVWEDGCEIGSRFILSLQESTLQTGVFPV